jgi:HEAT repeat protein
MLWLTLRRLNSSDPATREAAAEKLASSNNPRAVEALAKALHDPELRVRRAAAAALGKIGGELAIRSLLDSFWDSTSLIQFDAAAALARIGIRQSRRWFRGCKPPTRGSVR